MQPDVHVAHRIVRSIPVVGASVALGQKVSPFQELSTRIKRKHDIEEAVEQTPVIVYLFDLLYIDGQSLLDYSLNERLNHLTACLNPEPWDIELAQHTRSDPDTPAPACEL